MKTDVNVLAAEEFSQLQLSKTIKIKRAMSDCHKQHQPTSVKKPNKSKSDERDQIALKRQSVSSLEPLFNDALCLFSGKFTF